MNMRAGENLLSSGKYILSFILIMLTYKINGLMSPSQIVKLREKSKITKANPAIIIGTINNRCKLEQ